MSKTKSKSDSASSGTGRDLATPVESGASGNASGTAVGKPGVGAAADSKIVTSAVAGGENGGGDVSGAGGTPAPKRGFEAVSFWLRSARSLILLFLVIVTVVAGLLVGIGVYRTYFAMPEEIEVPVIQGKDLREVNRLLSDIGLRLRLEEGKYSNKFPEQIVLSQQPAPGETVRRDREVLAVVSLGPELMTVPDLSGKTERDAEVLLAENKLMLGKVTQVDKEGVTTNAIVSQKPSAGTRLKRGSKVNIEVNRSEARVSMAVPDWTGKNIAGATKLIQKAGLKLGRICWSKSTKIQQGFVISQSPPQGAEVAAGSEVDLEVSAGSDDTRMVVQRYLDVVLPQGSYSHDVRVLLISGAGQQEVYNARQVVGERLQLWVAGCSGSDIEVYVNGIVVKRDRL